MSTFIETQPTWLSNMLDGVLGYVRFRQLSMLVKALQSDPRGRELLANPDAMSALRGGLAAAADRKRELKRNPKLDTASPSHEGARVIAEWLGITL
jgi:hypothetical protein